MDERGSLRHNILSSSRISGHRKQLVYLYSGVYGLNEATGHFESGK